MRIAATLAPKLPAPGLSKAGRFYLPLPRIPSKIRGMTTFSPQAFVAKWRFVQLKERSAY
jgi:hypothetical protein